MDMSEGTERKSAIRDALNRVNNTNLQVQELIVNIGNSVCDVMSQEVAPNPQTETKPMPPAGSSEMYTDLESINNMLLAHYEALKRILNSLEL